MRCNFGCCRGFFGIGVGRVPRNLSCVLNSCNNNHCCCNCCNDNHRNDRDDECDCDNVRCEYNSRNRSC